MERYLLKLPKVLFKISENVRIGKQVVDLSIEGYGNSDIDTEISNVLGTEPVQMAAAPAFGPVVALPAAELGQFLKRLAKIRTINLSPSDAFASSIVSFIPTTDLMANAAIQDKVENFHLIRASVEVTFVITVPPGAYGSYAICAVPRKTYNGATFIPLGVSFEAAFQLPHVILDLSKSNNATLTLPWILDMDYSTVEALKNGDSDSVQWAIRVICLSPVAMGNGDLTPSGILSVYARFSDDLQLIVPRRQGFDDMRNEVNTSLGVKPSSIAASVSAGAAALSAVPVIGPLAGVVSGIAGAVGGVLDWFGFTRATNQQTPSIYIQRNFSNLANLDVDDTSEVSALFRDNSIAIDRSIVSAIPEDEAAFASIFSKWTYVGRAALTQSMAVGTEVAVFPVTPFIARRGMTGGSTTQFTSAGSVGWPFQYWRGGMEYMFIIPVSQFHRGAIQVSWYPDASVSTEDVTNITYNTIMDLTASQQFHFSVGYMSNEPVLLCTPKLFSSTITTASDANGLLRITVVNPLICNVATANTHIHVLARAASDMQFGVPRQTFQPLENDGSLGAARDFATGWLLQSNGTIGDTKEVKVKMTELVPSSAAYPLKEVCFGEDIRSVRALMQKFSFDRYLGNVFNYHAGLNTSPIVHHRIAPLYAQNDFYATPLDSPEFTYSGYYSTFFVGVAASVRYKFINTGSAGLGIGATSQDFNGGLSVMSNSTLSHMNCTKPMEGFEMTVPYYHRRKYISSTCFFTANEAFSGGQGRNDMITASRLTPGDTSSRSIAGYSAFGPDIRLAPFRCCPAIYVLETSGIVEPTYGSVPAIPPPA